MVMQQIFNFSHLQRYTAISDLLLVIRDRCKENKVFFCFFFFFLFVFFFVFFKYITQKKNITYGYYRGLR